ncbi:polysaccharide deacetylase family protein [Nonomuraea sp. NPDC050310]|uniref:polysaccharide deacetylase family protein n=1 Tax=unclassified Nonomuraea TaxID=2593643 RepID=UPI0033C91A55
MIGQGLLALVLAATPLHPATQAAVDCSKVKCIALTFDDGPGKRTGELLKTFKKAKAKATFFLVGRAVERDPALARQIVADKHEVGNHTYSHPSLTSLDDEAIADELAVTQQAIKAATGVRPKYFRPPYGHSDDRVLHEAYLQDLAQVKWTATSLDWSIRDTERIRNKVLKLAKRNAVILMHDPVPQTVAAMPEVLAELKKRGFHLVTVSTLLGERKLAPGEKYP